MDAAGQLHLPPPPFTQPSAQLDALSKLPSAASLLPRSEVGGAAFADCVDAAAHCDGVQSARAAPVYASLANMAEPSCQQFYESGDSMVDVDGAQCPYAVQYVVVPPSDAAPHIPPDAHFDPYHQLAEMPLGTRQQQRGGGGSVRTLNTVGAVSRSDTPRGVFYYERMTNRRSAAARLANEKRLLQQAAEQTAAAAAATTDECDEQEAKVVQGPPVKRRRGRKWNEPDEEEIGTFLHKNVNRRGHVEFILAALSHLKAFGVHRDLETYKKLIGIFPKGKFVPANKFQIAFRHYPKHNQACVRVLDMMEHYSVVPDKELYDMVVNTFGEWSTAGLKIKRQAFWMMKFKHADPYRRPRVAPKSQLEKAKMALRAMCRDPATRIEVFTMENYSENDEAWVCSGQSPMQQFHITELPENETLYVDGPERVYVSGAPLLYYTLCGGAPGNVHFHDFAEDDPTSSVNDEDWKNWQSRFTRAGRRRQPDRSRSGTSTPTSRSPKTIHEQSDGLVLALCVPGAPYSNAQLSFWLQCLQGTNPRLEHLPLVFRFRSNISREVARVESDARA